MYKRQIFRSFVAAESVGIAGRALKLRDYKVAYKSLMKFENDSIEDVWVGSCQFMLGYLIYHGLATDRDIDRAIDVIQKSAWAGNGDAISYLKRRSKMQKAGYEVLDYSPRL